MTTVKTGDRPRFSSLPSDENSGSVPTVYIVDDEAPLRNALSLLARSVQLQARSFGTAQEFLADYRPDRPACLIVDVRMPGISGIELIERLRDEEAPLAAIVMTGHGDVDMAVRAMKAGALDFIEKPFKNQALLDLVQEGLARAAREALRRQSRDDARTRLGRLTPRETEVMALIVEGEVNKVIAQRLGLSTRTVELHRARIMEKTAAHSVSELVRLTLLAGHEP